MNTQTRLMSLIRTFTGDTLAERLEAGNGIAHEEVRVLARLAGMRQWHPSPCGSSRQPLDLLGHVHRILGLRIYGPRANLAAGRECDGADVTSAEVIRNLAAADVVVVADPQSSAGSQLLASSMPVPIPPQTPGSRFFNSIQQAAMVDAFATFRAGIAGRRAA